MWIGRWIEEEGAYHELAGEDVVVPPYFDLLAGHSADPIGVRFDLHTDSADCGSKMATRRRRRRETDHTPADAGQHACEVAIYGRDRWVCAETLASQQTYHCTSHILYQ